MDKDPVNPVRGIVPVNASSKTSQHAFECHIVLLLAVSITCTAVSPMQTLDG